MSSVTLVRWPDGQAFFAKAKTTNNDKAGMTVRAPDLSGKN